ncbi:MAG TPA: hypothetical protein VMS86_14000 [Thermoanaerobaculia bacterium]|nr:hypothetical protein [Thermoanaerobaculia bacterium]
MRSFLQAVLGPFDALLGAIPLEAARWIVVGFFLIAGAGALLVPRAFVFRGAPDDRWHRDLRLWAILVLLPYLLIYAFL